MHWLGTGWLAACGLAALIWALDSYGTRTDQGQDRSSRGLIGALRSPTKARRRGAYAVVFGIIVLSRLPYVLTYWPGIVYFDTFRAYSYIRGIVPLDTYEPVGSTLYIGAMQGLGAFLGLGDAGRVALSTMTLLVASAAAYTFLFARLASWGLPGRFWIAGLAWIALVPALGYYSVTLVKDVPFSIALTVFMVCIGEITFGDASATRRLWPWVTMTVTGVVAITMRNNGVYIVLLTLPVLFVLLRRSRKQVLIVLVALVAAVALWFGPTFAVLHVRPGPAEETYSVPLQQLGRIAKYHANSLSPGDQRFMTRIFAGMPPAELGRHYVPALADPMKLRARLAWETHTTLDFLRGWARIASQYPLTAIGATMANTVGYWDPEAPPYDGIDRWSANDARTIHLDIPSGRPTTGVAGALESSGIMPTRAYDGVHDNGYRLIPCPRPGHDPGDDLLALVCGRPARPADPETIGDSALRPGGPPAADVLRRSGLRRRAIHHEHGDDSAAGVGGGHPHRPEAPARPTWRPPRDADRSDPTYPGRSDAGRSRSGVLDGGDPVSRSVARPPDSARADAVRHGKLP